MRNTDPVTQKSDAYTTYAMRDRKDARTNKSSLSSGGEKTSAIERKTISPFPDFFPHNAIREQQSDSGASS